MHCGRMKGNEHKLKQGRLRLVIRKIKFPIWTGKQWNRLPREITETLSLETFKSHPDTILCTVL